MMSQFQRQDVECPLCGYNLRGLSEPRCPECGFAFQWDELLNRDGARHRYLFELARHRKFPCFLATYLHTCLPRRFWSELTPTHPVRLRRLLSYFVLTLLISLLPIAGLIARPGWYQYQYSASIRRHIRPIPGRTDAVYLGTRFVTVGTPTTGPSTMPLPAKQVPATWYWDQIDEWYPLPQHRQFWINAWEDSERTSFGEGIAKTPDAVLAVGCLLFVWPIMTLLTGCIFAWSMRRAKVRFVHVLRTAIYASDTGLLLLFAWAVLYCANPRFNLASVIAISAACLALTTWYRLAIANHRYLHLHRPIATALATQLIAYLTICLAVIYLFDLARMV